ncbi:hypothetical protein [Nitrobacter sp. TKz-YC02]|uniref:hypothetical protein n=1 Tax=Nitrobacter sp. TKz-YC02 TaxID=3398704 RepID=UPI003CF685E1
MATCWEAMHMNFVFFWRFINRLDCDTKQLLVGFVAEILFGIIVITSPSFDDFVDHYMFSYLTEGIKLLTKLIPHQ